MADVFIENFDGGTVGQPFTTGQLAYPVVVPVAPTRVAGQSGQNGVARFDGAAGSGYVQQVLSPAAKVRTLSRDVVLTSGTHTSNNAVLLETNRDDTQIVGQVTYRASGKLAIRGGSTGAVLVAETAETVVPGRIYRLVWTLNGSTQTLTVTDRATGATWAPITGALVDGNGFNHIREGWVSNPTGTVVLDLDRAVDSDTATANPGTTTPTPTPTGPTPPSGSVFYEAFWHGEAGQPITKSADLAYTKVVNGPPTYVVSPLSNDLAAQVDGALGSGYLELALATPATTRTLEVLLRLDAGTHTTGSVVLWELLADATTRGQVVLRAGNTLALRQGTVLRKESTTALAAGTTYRLQWTVSGGRQMLRIYRGATLVETLTADFDSGGFATERLGLVNNPTGTLKVLLDDAVDYSTAASIPADSSTGGGTTTPTPTPSPDIPAGFYEVRIFRAGTAPTDTTAPTTAVTSPAVGSTTSRTVLVEGTYSDG